MEFFRFKLQKYFESNQDKLLETYPGLKLSFLREELTQYSYLHSKSLEASFELLKKHLENKIPLQYFFGQAYFYNSYLSVGTDVLIPRSETEQLVEWAETELKKISGPVSVIDIGTGSGAILVALGQLSWDKKVLATGVDISISCLELAKLNQWRMGYKLSPNFHFQWAKSDRLNDLETSMVDVIVTNPPYIKATSDRSKVKELVHKHEPHTALYLDDERYNSWFEELFQSCFDRLKIGGSFLMEGHEDHLPELKIMAQAIFGPSAEVYPDLTGNLRYLKAKKNGM